MQRDVVLERLRGVITPDDIVVAVYQTLFDWMGLGLRDLDYVSTGAMGMASSHGLGLAIANPDRKVFVLDGDGSLLMNLGSLVTVASEAPENFHHILFENGRYEVNGNHPIPGDGNIDFAGLARSCGYRSTATISGYHDLDACFDGIGREPGPSFLCMRIRPGRTHPRDYEYIHSEAARERFRKALAWPAAQVMSR